MEITTTTTIKTSELKKLMKNKGIKSVYQLARIAGVDYSYLNRAIQGHTKMSSATWDKIKICL